MLQLLCMSLLGACYVKAVIDEAEEEKRRKEEERIFDLKLTVFCYAIRHGLLYNDVLKMLHDKKLTFEDIQKDSEENERNQRAY